MEAIKLYCVYFPYTQQQATGHYDSSKPRYAREYAKVRRYRTPREQLDAYANTMCPPSMTFEADSEEEFNRKVEELKDNFENEEWLKENVYPFI